MRSSVAVRRNKPFTKIVSLICAVTLCCGLVPSAAFAADDSSRSLIPEGEQGAAPIVSGAEGGSDDAVSHNASEDALSVDGGGAASTSEDANDIEDPAATDSAEAGDNALGKGISNGGTAIPAADLNIINQVEPLQVIAKTESTRSYFLAQTLESTRTVPVVSAKLPVDTGAIDEPVASAEDVSVDGVEGDSSEATEGGEDPDESGLGADPATTDGANHVSEVSAASTVVGSFMHLGMTFAIEPGGDSVALVAADYSQLPQEFIEKQIVVIPDMATADSIDFYSVTRIADKAFTGFTEENANPDYVGCQALPLDGEILVEASIDSAEIDALLDAKTDELDVGDDSKVDIATNPFAHRSGILIVGIPLSISIIEDEAFVGFNTLQWIDVEDDNVAYGSYDGALYDANLMRLLFVPEGRVGTIYLAESTNSIDQNAFSQSSSIAAMIAEEDCGIALDEIPQHIPFLYGSTQKPRWASKGVSLSAVIKEIFERNRWNSAEVQAAIVEASDILDDQKAVYAADAANKTFAANGCDTWTTGVPKWYNIYGGITGAYFMLKANSADNNRSWIWVRKQNVSTWTPICYIGTWTYYGFSKDGPFTSLTMGQSYEITGTNLYLTPFSGGLDYIDRSFWAYGVNTWSTSSPVWYGVASASGASFKLEANSDDNNRIWIWVRKKGATKWDPAFFMGGWAYYGYSKDGPFMPLVLGKSYEVAKTSLCFTPFSGGLDYIDRTFRVCGYDTWSADAPAWYWIESDLIGAAFKVQGNTADNNRNWLWVRKKGVANWNPICFIGNWTYYSFSQSGPFASLVTEQSYEVAGSTLYFSQYPEGAVDLFTISWEAGNGSTAEKTKQAPGYDITPPSDPVRTGYVFAGWWTAPTGGTQVGIDGGITKGEATDVTYYAQWTEAQYPVTFDKGAGTATASWNPSSGLFEYESQSFTAPSANDLTRRGYTLVGWSTSMNPANVDSVTTGKLTIEEGDSTTMEALYEGVDVIPSTGITLYPVWRVDAYTIALSRDGGTYESTSLSALTTKLSSDASGKAKFENDTVTYTVLTPAFTLPVLTKAGCSFAGWIGGGSSSNPSVTIDPADASITLVSDLIYTVDWSYSEYRIAYYQDDAKTKSASWEADASVTTAFGVDGPATMTIPDPVRKGWTFTGWSGLGLTGSDNKGSVTVDLSSLITASLPKAPDIALQYVAHWTQDAYTVTYVLNEASDNYAGAFASGYAGFSGTAPSEQADGTYADSYRYDETGTASVLMLPNKTGDAYDLMRPGYLFAGWKRTDDDSNAPVSSIDPKSSAENMTLQALWNPVASVALPAATTPQTIGFVLDRATGNGQEVVEGSASQALKVSSTTPVDCELSVRSEAGSFDIADLFEPREGASASDIADLVAAMGFVFAADGSGLADASVASLSFLHKGAETGALKVKGSEQFASKGAGSLSTVDVGGTLKLAQKRDSFFDDIAVDTSKISIKSMDELPQGPLTFANIIWTVSLP